MLKPKDISRFFADRNALDPEEYLFVDYLFETTDDPRLSAANLCSEQSTAQWSRPGFDEDLRVRYGAKVVSLKVGEKKPAKDNQKILSQKQLAFECQIQVAHPLLNFGPRIPNILSVIAGEGTFYCPGISAIKVMDIHMPDSFLKNFEGPQFGVSGLRTLLQIFNRPFFFGVVKPNIGLPPAEWSQLAYEAWMGGCDIVKDDEMLANAPYSSIEERTKYAGEALRRSVKESKNQKMLITNVTDEQDSIIPLYLSAKNNGANGVMLNGFFTGLGSIRTLRKKSELPMMGHFTGLALYDRVQNFGIDGRVLVKLQRMAGCDIIGIPGFGERMRATNESVLKNIQACLMPLGNMKTALPVPGGSDWAGTLPEVYAKIGHPDFGFISGRGIFGHPEGARAGALSLRIAWSALENEGREFSLTKG